MAGHKHPDGQSDDRREEQNRIKNKKTRTTDIFLNFDCGDIEKEQAEQDEERRPVDECAEKDLPDFAVEEGRIGKKYAACHQPFEEGRQHNTYRVGDCKNRSTVDRMTPEVRNRPILVKAR